MEKQAYSVKEFCQLFSISPAHLYKLNKNGKGPTMIKAGRKTLIPHRAAMEWIESRSVVTIEPVPGHPSRHRIRIGR
jgi:predicted DNA-binding transcriptional regulator AlpA